MSGIVKFDRVIDALKALKSDEPFVAQIERINAIKNATESLKNTLELKGAWYALSIVKSLLGTLGELASHCAIPVLYGVQGFILGFLSGSPLLTVIGTTLAVNEGVKKTVKWTPNASNYISSSTLFLPSAFRANKAAELDTAVKEVQMRVSSRRR